MAVQSVCHVMYCVTALAAQVNAMQHIQPTTTRTLTSHELVQEVRNATQSVHHVTHHTHCHTRGTQHNAVRMARVVWHHTNCFRKSVATTRPRLLTLSFCSLISRSMSDR